jgi:hypothetical protein
MQNKPNSRKTKIAATAFSQRAYENIRHFFQRKNKAKTNPNKPKLRKDKNERIFFPTKDLCSNSPLLSRKKQSQNKPNFQNVKK